MESGSRETGRVKLSGLPVLDIAARRALVERLTGHVLDPGWLPAAGVLGEALAAERAEHLRQLEGLRAAADAYRDAQAGFEAEDRQHVAALRAHVRDGGEPPADERTGPADRESRVAALREDLEARLVVLAGHVERVVGDLGDRQDQLLGELRALLEPADAKRREAERLLAEARGELWQLAQTGRWLQMTAADGPLGRQPAPIPSPPPPTFSEESLKWALEVPWHKRQQTEGPVPWQELGEEAAADGDPTGQLSGLDEHGAAA
jgi:hypothetical protein